MQQATKCTTCSIGELEEGIAAYTLDNKAIFFGIEQVTALICSKCNSTFFDQKVKQRLEERAALMMANQSGFKIFVYPFKIVWNYRNRKKAVLN